MHIRSIWGKLQNSDERNLKRTIRCMEHCEMTNILRVEVLEGGERKGKD